MTKKTFLSVGKLLTIGWSSLIIILCLMPADDLPKEEWFPNLDKVVHFTFYFVLSNLLLIILELQNARFPKIRLLLAIFTMSLVIEILQLILPVNRSFSLFDLIANASGIVFGWAFNQKFISARISSL